jgi:hypothetical protein
MSIIGRRKIITAKTNGGSGTFSQEIATFNNDNDRPKSLGRKHTSKQLREKALAAVALVVFLGLLILIPVLLWCHINNDGPVPKPWGWERWGYYNFIDSKLFDCRGYLHSRTKPLPTMEYWQTMLNAYNQVVDPTYKFNDEVPPTQGYRLNKYGPQPYYAKLSPGKGRGVFASRDIKKGEIVHDGSKSGIIFQNATSWKRFMFALPRKMACDNAAWTFTQRYEEGGPM